MPASRDGFFYRGVGMTINFREDDSIAILRVNGQINLYNVTELKDVFQKALDKGLSRFLIDMKMVNYVDSSGVGAFILHLNNLKKIEGKMAFCNIDNNVRVLFEMTKLNNFFQIFEKDDEAYKYLKS